jgi:hypothetical protein
MWASSEISAYLLMYVANAQLSFYPGGVRAGSQLASAAGAGSVYGMASASYKL